LFPKQIEREKKQSSNFARVFFRRKKQFRHKTIFEPCVNKSTMSAVVCGDATTRVVVVEDALRRSVSPRLSVAKHDDE
jgi:hypothetical protein